MFVQVVSDSDDDDDEPAPTQAYNISPDKSRATSNNNNTVTDTDGFKLPTIPTNSSTHAVSSLPGAALALDGDDGQDTQEYAEIATQAYGGNAMDTEEATQAYSGDVIDTAATQAYGGNVMDTEEATQAYSGDVKDTAVTEEEEAQTNNGDDIIDTAATQAYGEASIQAYANTQTQAYDGVMIGAGERVPSPVTNSKDVIENESVACGRGNPKNDPPRSNRNTRAGKRTLKSVRIEDAAATTNNNELKELDYEPATKKKPVCSKEASLVNKPGKELEEPEIVSEKRVRCRTRNTKKVDRTNDTSPEGDPNKEIDEKEPVPNEPDIKKEPVTRKKVGRGKSKKTLPEEQTEPVSKRRPSRKQNDNEDDDTPSASSSSTSSSSTSSARGKRKQTDSPTVNNKANTSSRRLSVCSRPKVIFTGISDKTVEKVIIFNSICFAFSKLLQLSITSL